MVYVPLIAHIKGSIEEVILLGLGKHKDIGTQAMKLRGSLLPELDRHQHSHIAPKAIYVELLDPVAHSVDMSAPHVVIGIVELSGIAPVPGHLSNAIVIALVPIGRALRNPACIARRMVSHPI